ncbi:hypothetical protein J8L70_14470 [Pseudoalteromonas sp. MMG010]|nr:hypothetical protein [Pseudoalteromonas sp. MMG010]
MIVADYIDSALNVAKYYEKQFNPLLQELYLRRAYNEVINSMCDSLVHNAIRKQCFEQLYKPLLALKRFYKTHHVSNKFVLLEHEVRTLSHEFNQEQL